MTIRNILWIGLLSAVLTSALCAQDIAGQWQGTLKTGARELRQVVTIAKATDGGWNATLFSIDQDFGNGVPINSVTLQGSNLKLTIDRIRGTYEGRISGDRTSIAGTWTQGRSLPLELKRATPETAWSDSSPHTIHFMAVDKDVKLEVLDWGGSGRPLVLLTGLGNTAHVYDEFAEKLTSQYHVYGITRRGYGASSAPAPTSVNYLVDRLGDDVLAVLDFLNLNRPILVGHSIAGEELSSVGSRRPEKVAGLIYLDAGYSYAYYDSSRGDFDIDRIDLQRRLEQLPISWDLQMTQIRELLETSLPQFEKGLREQQKRIESAPGPPVVSAQPQPAMLTVEQAIQAGIQKYTDIRVPILAIYALPHERGITDPVARAAADASDLSFQGAMAKAFEKGLPSARVLWLAHADHYVFRSNEADVLREMNAFLAGLP